jgi:glucose-6-phosphate isomerase
MTAPVDPTTTSAWSRLTSAATTLRPDLRGWFDADPARAQRFTFDCADLHVDLSKNLLTTTSWRALVASPTRSDLAGRRDAMFARGPDQRHREPVGAAHRAAAAGRHPELVVDGQDVVADVHETLDKVYAFADRVRSGEWKGVTGKAIETVVNIGIGGSDLGPVMVYEALAPYVQDGSARPLRLQHRPHRRRREDRRSGPRDHAVHRRQQDLHDARDPHQRADGARPGCSTVSSSLGAIDDTRGIPRLGRGQALRRRVDRLGQGRRLRHRPGQRLRLLGLGGRPLLGRLRDRHCGVAVAIGPERFADFLAGFHAVDEHFRTTPLERNVPALMGLLNVWYVNHLDARSHAVLPYAQYLHRFAAYLQQLTMESNGKSVRWDGSR